MDRIRKYGELFRDPNYDRRNNPKHLSVRELQPIAIEWFAGNKQNRVDFNDYASVVPLLDRTGVAVVEFDSSDEGKGGKAYIINPDGTKRFDVKLPQKYAKGRFSDVYYIGNDLHFFFYDEEDYRALIDVNTGEVKSVNISR